jgi:hypothetical protein
MWYFSTIFFRNIDVAKLHGVTDDKNSTAVNTYVKFHNFNYVTLSVL